MAESRPNSNLENTKNSMPSNEVLVESLLADFKECIIKEDSSKTEINTLNCENVGESVNKKNITDRSDISPNENVSHVLDENEDIIGPDDEEEEERLTIPSTEDDMVDELAMKDRELTYTEEDRQRLHKEAEGFKQNGNELFKSGQYRESALAYTEALRTCPLAFSKDRAIFYANRAAAKMKLELNESAIEDCTKSLELEEKYLKVLLRRAQLYELTDKLDESLEDYKKVLEIDPLHSDALHASKRLPELINEKNEKLKTEMLGKLKDLGNMFLKPFGLSTENFQMTQDPNSGGYSINFKS